MTKKAWVGCMLPVVMGAALVGCASSGKARLSPAKMCASVGGSYQSTTHTCDAPPINQKKASEMCAASGGVYFAAEDMCEIDVSK